MAAILEPWRPSWPPFCDVIGTIPAPILLTMLMSLLNTSDFVYFISKIVIMLKICIHRIDYEGMKKIQRNFVLAWQKNYKYI